MCTVKPNNCHLHAQGDSLAGTFHAGILLVQVRHILPYQTEALSAMYVGGLDVLYGREPRGKI